MLIDWPKIPQVPQNLSVQFVCTSPKVLDFNEKRLHWASVVRAQMHPGQALKKLFLFSPSKIELSGEFFAHVTSLKNTAKQVATKSLQTFGCILHAYLIRCPKCGPWYSISRKNYGLFHLCTFQIVQILVHSYFNLVSWLLPLEAVSEPLLEMAVELINIHLISVQRKRLA